MMDRQNDRQPKSSIASLFLKRGYNKPLTLCILGNFPCLCCRLLTVFKINFFKKFFQLNYQKAKLFGSGSRQHSVRPDLGQTVCEGNQQMTKVTTSKESKALHFQPSLKKPAMS